jgi:hypothetical protein
MNLAVFAHDAASCGASQEPRELDDGIGCN